MPRTRSTPFSRRPGRRSRGGHTPFRGRFRPIARGFEPLEDRCLLAAVAWVGGASGYWDVAANWSSGAVPSSASAVSIATNGATVTIRSGDSASAGSLAVAAGSGLAVTGGSLTTAAGLSNGGTLTVGPANTVTVNGTLAQTTTGTLDVQLGGGPSTGNFGSVAVAGAAALAGTLRADLVDGYAPATTDTFTPVTFASQTGSFSTFTLPSGTGYQLAAAVSFTNIAVSAAPAAAVSATVNTADALQPVAADLLGINTAYWDSDAVTAQTQQMVTAAGLDIYRFPGGSAADDFHFNVAANWGDSGAITIAQFAQFTAAEGGTGVVTLDYGSGSPQEAAAELAYLDGSTSDNTSLGNGIQWNDSTGQWQTVNWGTVAYWAGLRAAAPRAHDDGLNFLRIDHPAPFSNFKYWEVGNEEYGSWEVDHHGTATPGGAGTGAAHDPATYAAFAQQFASLAGEIQTAAGLPPISIGIDSGDPTGASDGNWTKNVLAAGLTDGFVPGFISDHNYVQAPGAESDSFLLDDTVSDGGSVLDWTTRYADYQTLLVQTLGTRAASVQVLATEYNSVYSNPGKQSTSLVNGLFVAESLGGLLDSGYAGGFVWDLRNYFDTSQNNSNALYGWREGGDYGVLGDPNADDPPTSAAYVAYPDYYALQLGSKIIQSGGEVVSAASNYADLDTYAVLEPSGDLDLLVINTNPAAALTGQFSLSGFQPSGAAEVWQYGKTQDTAQSQSAAGSSALANFGATLSLSGSTFNYAFPAYSMTVLDLGRAVVTVTAAGAAKNYGAADPAFSVSYAGFAGGDSAAVLGGTLTFSTTEPGGGPAPAGTYQIIPAGLTSSKYTLVFAAGTLTVSSTVAGRYVFYADSYYDGNSQTASAADDAAIATDKTALLPGGAATAANFIDSSQGINGIMVDVAGLAAPGKLSAADFQFAVGNDSTPADWTAPTAAPSVTVRAGAGTGGSDRVELIWPSGAIHNQWLQVTVLADAHTGLAANDVFYFGSEPGAVEGNTYASFDDIFAVYRAIGNTPDVSVTTAADVDHDGMVTFDDIFAVYRAIGGAQLAMITVPAAAVVVAAAPAAAPTVTPAVVAVVASSAVAAVSSAAAAPPPQEPTPASGGVSADGAVQTPGVSPPAAPVAAVTAERHCVPTAATASPAPAAARGAARTTARYAATAFWAQDFALEDTARWLDGPGDEPLPDENPGDTFLPGAVLGRHQTAAG